MKGHRFLGFLGITLQLLFSMIDCRPEYLSPLALLRHNFLKHLQSQAESGSLGEGKEDNNPCRQKLFQILSQGDMPSISLQYRIYMSSGKTLNDLGLYDYCLDEPELKYVLVQIETQEDGISNDIQFGLCVPNVCTKEHLHFLDNFYTNGMVIKQSMKGYDIGPICKEPRYIFPKDEEGSLWGEKGVPLPLAIMIFVLLGIVLLSVIGYAIGKTTLGDKPRAHSSLVVTVDEDNLSKISIESRKQRWALFLYSFSFSRNFQEIFTKPYRTIRDKRLEVFDGLRVHMLAWIILGHCYLLGSAFGQETAQKKKLAFENVFSQIVVSADYPISFMYFMSGFIGMFAMIKKFQQSPGESAEGGGGSRKEQVAADGQEFTVKSINVPKLSKRALVRQVLARWLRLAFPTYILIAITICIFPYLASGPTFIYYNVSQLQDEVKRHWYSYVLFVSNIYPPQEEQGLYWLFFIANEFQYYVLVLVPSVYLYLKRHKRRLVLGYLIALVLESMLYLFVLTMVYNYSILLTVETDNMFDELFRYPFAPVGYYAMGVMFAIFYFEYNLSVSNRELKKMKATRFLDYLGKTKQRRLYGQAGGAVLLTFLVFIRYTAFISLTANELNDSFVDRGTWYTWVNALFNSFSHYLFVVAVTLIFLPIFLGKFSILRDIYAAQFFRPFARTSFTLACFQGLGIIFVFLSQSQPMLFEHKNFLFLFCGILILGSILNLFLSLLLEWPFRTMGKLVFSAPRRIMFKLKGDLARELNTNDYDEYEEIEQEEKLLQQEEPGEKEPHSNIDDLMSFASGSSVSSTKKMTAAIVTIENESRKKPVEQVVKIRTSINEEEDGSFGGSSLSSYDSTYSMGELSKRKKRLTDITEEEEEAAEFRLYTEEDPFTGKVKRN